jgi:hypothetical protein
MTKERDQDTLRALSLQMDIKFLKMHLIILNKYIFLPLNIPRGWW